MQFARSCQVAFRFGASHQAQRPLGVLLSVVVSLTIVSSCTTVQPARCAYADFSVGSSHMTNVLPGPFVVRELKGRFVPAFADEELGDWISDENTIRLQVNGPGGMTLRVPVRPDGSFYVSDLPEGRYCFHSASEGLQGYEGTIVISSHAPFHALVRVEVALGV
jgi:hypothetical protein